MPDATKPNYTRTPSVWQGIFLYGFGLILKVLYNVNIKKKGLIDQKDPLNQKNLYTNILLSFIPRREKSCQQR